ncbi:MAG: hypothetical protein HKL96_04235 [Phycisphaerales bacterium]|nr:hypothetical protein [Phycisphaerales bacterium]
MSKPSSKPYRFIINKDLKIFCLADDKLSVVAAKAASIAASGKAALGDSPARTVIKIEAIA